MDLWQLRYFVCAAEHLNFTKAAESLHISQSALSKKIADLEHHFDVQLFIRGRQSLSLTAAGKAFLEESRMILSKWDETFHKIRQAASGSIGTLRIGYTGGFVTRILPPLIQQYRKKAPDITLHVERGNIRVLIKSLLEGELDVAFIVGAEKDKEISPDLEWKSIKQDRLSIVLPAQHRLAGKKELTPSQLADESFVFMARSENHTVFDMFIHICTEAGFVPNLVSQPTMLETLLLLVESGLGITILSPLAETGAHPNLRMVPLKGNHPVHLFLVWKKENKNPAIPMFVEALEKMQVQDNRL